MDISEISGRNTERAFEIIDDLQIINTWHSFGARANLVGSLCNGLLMKNKDIDFHIYSDSFSIKDSFGAMAAIAEKPGIERVTYVNLTDTEEMCIEWHAWYRDTDQELWQIDMIHLLKESPFAGRIEQVTERIGAVLTPELRMTILSIKNDVPDEEKIPGIEIYQAVIRDGVKSYKEFIRWRKKQNMTGIIDWMP